MQPVNILSAPTCATPKYALHCYQNREATLHGLLDTHDEHLPARNWIWQLTYGMPRLIMSSIVPATILGTRALHYTRRPRFLELVSNASRRLREISKIAITTNPAWLRGNSPVWRQAPSTRHNMKTSDKRDRRDRSQQGSTGTPDRPEEEVSRRLNKIFRPQPARKRTSRQPHRHSH